MKTTVEISDALLEGARELAAARSTTLRQIIEEGLVRVIDDSSKKRVRYRLPDMAFGGKGPAPNKSWDEIRDMIYKGRGA